MIVPILCWNSFQVALITDFAAAMSMLSGVVLVLAAMAMQVVIHDQMHWQIQEIDTKYDECRHGGKT